MGFLFVLVGCVGGLFVGGTFGNDGDAALGFFAGLAIGWAFARMRTLGERIEHLQGELRALRSGAAAATRAAGADDVPAAAVMDASDEAPATDAAEPSDGTTIDVPAEPPPPSPPPLPQPASATSTAPPRVAARVRAPAEPGPASRAGAAIRRWFTEGNVPVKIGMLVLFAGVAALLKYATDQAWFTLPVELRLAAIAAAAIAALAFGWRVRARRRAFALSLQGGAIGILVLTVFAAFRLYHLLPAGAAFALLVVLVAGAGVLAVVQDARALAMLGLFAGFAAPVLVSTGSGDHVALFGYYLVLNLAVLAIAWRKAWRVLNLLGFAFTFAIGTAWGVLRYEPALYASTQPFLLAFFAIYLAVPILHALRADTARRDLVDGTLVFGNPLFAFALQAALLQGERMPLAWSALALAAVYAVLGAGLLARRRVLGEAFAVLAAGFATLAVPLALSARSTACTFALEGAALVWLGLRQQRRLPEASGLALQALAAGAFALGQAGARIDDAVPLANPACIGALLLAVAAFASAWLYRRAQRERWALALYLWGIAWWCGAGIEEIERFVPLQGQAAAVLAHLAASAALAAFATARTQALATACTAAIALVAGVPVALWMGADRVQPFAAWPLAALAAFAASGVYALAVLGRRDDRTAAVGHVGWVWSWIAFAAVALERVAGDARLGGGWRAALAFAPLLAAWAFALLRPRAIAFPLQRRFERWRGALLLQLALVAGVVFWALLWHDGDARPLPWLPLLNPVELAQLGVLALGARSLASAAPAAFGAQRPRLLAVAGFLFVTAATLRATHQLGGVPWDARLWSSNLAQMALTLVWSALGMIGWIVGSRRGRRVLWLAGAVLMGVVLAKLLLIDRTRLGNLFGIASFIAYGLLCTVIGWFAPAPPRTAERESTP